MFTPGVPIAHSGTSLHRALYLGGLEAAQKLLLAGASLDVLDNQARSCIGTGACLRWYMCMYGGFVSTRFTSDCTADDFDVNTPVWDLTLDGPS